jgi:hypothetical protein
MTAGVPHEMSRWFLKIDISLPIWPDLCFPYPELGNQKEHVSRKEPREFFFCPESSVTH